MQLRKQPLKPFPEIKPKKLDFSLEEKVKLMKMNEHKVIERPVEEFSSLCSMARKYGCTVSILVPKNRPQNDKNKIKFNIHKISEDPI